MQIFEKDIAIDMGTSTTLLFEAGKGIVAREPTVVAIDKFNGKSGNVDDVTLKTGATRTSTAVRNGVNAALAAVATLIG